MITRYTIHLEDGSIYQITNLFDSDGNDTTDIDSAVTFVAKVADDNWLSGRLDSAEILGVALVH